MVCRMFLLFKKSHFSLSFWIKSYLSLRRLRTTATFLFLFSLFFSKLHHFPGVTPGFGNRALQGHEGEASLWSVNQHAHHRDSWWHNVLAPWPLAHRGSHRCHSAPQATVPNAQCPGVHRQTSLWWAPVLSRMNPPPLCPSRLQGPCSLLGWDQHLPQKHQPPHPCRQHNSVASIIHTHQCLYDGFHACNFQLFISTKRCEFSPVTKTQ